MRFGHRRNIPIWIQGLIVIIGIAVISALFIYEKVEEERMEQYVLQMEKEERKKLIPSDENSINVLQDNGFVTDVPEQGKLVLSSETFRENYERTSRSDVAATSVSVDLSKQSFYASKIYLLRFRMKAEENAAIVNVNFGKKYNFFITTEWNSTIILVQMRKLRLLSGYWNQTFKSYKYQMWKYMNMVRMLTYRVCLVERI